MQPVFRFVCTLASGRSTASGAIPGDDNHHTSFYLQGWVYPRERENYGFWRRFLVTSIIIFPSLGIALAVPGKSSDIVTATGDTYPPPYALHMAFEFLPHNSDDDGAVLGMSPAALVFSPHARTHLPLQLV